MSNINSQYIEWLRTSVQTAMSIQDVIPFIQIVSVSQIQCFLLDAISQLDHNATRKAYFNTLSIMDTLPGDIIQHIESFDSDNKHAIVNKKWNEYRIQNCRRRNEAILKNLPLEFAHLVGDNSTTTTWNIYPDHITHQSITNVNDIDDAISKSNPGDKFLVHNGEYHFADEVITHDMQFIGVGDDVRFILPQYVDEDPDDECAVCVGEGAAVYFENITFDYHNHSSYEGTIKLSPRSQMWMKRCNVMFGIIGISCFSDVSLYIQNCRFKGGSCAISVQSISKALLVTDSIFTNCGHETIIMHEGTHSCIEVNNEVEDAHHRNPHELGLKCIGNTFLNNLCVPIAEKHHASEKRARSLFKKTNVLVLEHNTAEECSVNVTGLDVLSPMLNAEGWTNPNIIYYTTFKYKQLSSLFT